MTPVIEGLKKEHEKFRKYLSLFEAELVRLGDDGSLNYELIDCLLEYFTLFPDEWHHKKEDLIYDRLITRGGEIGEALYDLRGEHADLEASIKRFAERIAHMRIGHDLPAAVLSEDGARYVSLIRRHMSKEEALFMPVAERHLTENEWSQIQIEIRETLGPERERSEMIGRIVQLEAEIARISENA